MVASLHLMRWPLGAAQWELWRLRRRAATIEGASFSALILPIPFRYQPLPVGRLGTFGWVAVWPGPAEMTAFLESPLVARWEGASRALRLTLDPIRSFGSWCGSDPLGGMDRPDDGGPTLVVTHSRTRFADGFAFMQRSRRVAETLADASGYLWADGFMDRLSSFDTGTLSLWRTSKDATSFAYDTESHRGAIRASRERGWFDESWFGRFSVTSASGGWDGLDVSALTQVASASTSL